MPYPEQGRGAFVRPDPHVRLLLTGASYRRHRGLGLPGFNAQALEQGQAPEQRLREVATVSAPPEIALRLDVDAFRVKENRNESRAWV